MLTSPSEGRSSPPSKCNSVDLPQPLGPITAMNSPGFTVKFDVIERDDSRVARAVHFGEIFRLNERHGQLHR